MQRDFDSRALLRNTAAYTFKETKTSEAYKRLMNTDVFDLELEDKLNAVLEERGIEIFSKEYDKAIRELQDEFLREKNDYVEESFDFKGQVCGAGHISASYKCRIGGFDLSAATSEEDHKKLAKKAEAFEGAISGLSSSEQKGYKACVENAITSANRDLGSDERKVQAYGRILDNGKVLAEDGPPRSIINKAGEPQEMSEYIQPVMSRTGNMGWKDPVIGVGYTKHRQGEIDLEQNRESINNNLQDGRVKDAMAHYEKYKASPELQAKGAFGTPAVAKLREPSPEEVDKTWKSLDRDTKNRVALSGVDSVGGRRLPNGDIDQRSEHKAFYDRNPDLLEQRGKEVVAAYLAQSPAPGKPSVSAFTGKEIPLPGTFGPGGKAVVDHAVPLSKSYPSDRKNEWSRSAGLDIMRKADSRSNMVIVEGGLNHSKGNRENWDKQIVPQWNKKILAYEQNKTKAEKLPVFSRRSGAASTQNVQRTRVKTSRPSGTAGSGKTAAQKKADREAKQAGARKKRQEAETAKNEKKIAKLSKATNAAREKRDKHKPGSAMYKKWNAKVSEAGTAERRAKKDLGLL